MPSRAYDKVEEKKWTALHFNPLSGIAFSWILHGTLTFQKKKGFRLKENVD